MTDANTAPEIPGPDHAATTGAPPIWYASKRVIRTIIQTFIPAFITFALILPQIIDALGLPVTSKLYVWLVGASLFITAVAAALTRLMAIPAVNTFLTKLGAGSVPSGLLK